MWKARVIEENKAKEKEMGREKRQFNLSGSSSQGGKNTKRVNIVKGESTSKKGKTKASNPFSGRKGSHVRSATAITGDCVGGCYRCAEFGHVVAQCKKKA